MLKKGRKFWAIFAIIFGFLVSSCFGFSVQKNNKLGFASNTPELEVSSKVDGEYVFNSGKDIGEDDELTLYDANWDTTLELTNNVIITLHGDSIINCKGGTAVCLNGCNITITGVGSLTIIGEPAIECSGEETVELKGVNAYIGSNTEPASSFSLDDVFGQNYISFSSQKGLYGDASQDETETEHQHDFYFTFSGATLTAKCTSDCTLENNEVSTTLTATSVDYGENPTFSLTFDGINTVTGKNLSEQSYSKEIYKTDTKDSVEGGTLVDNPTNAGFYYVKLNFNSESGFEGKSLVCPFEIKKINPTVVGYDKTITYTSEVYDVSQMFEIPTEAGSFSYEIVSGGSGEGTLDGQNLSITKCGTILVKATTVGTENYNGIELTKTLTVEKLELENIEILFDDWDFNGTPSTPSISGNIGGGAVTFTYWKNAELTIPAGDGSIPTAVGVYFIKAEIAETNIYKSKVISKQFTIWGEADARAVSEQTEIKFDQIQTENFKFDVSTLFSFSENCGNVTYFYVDRESGNDVRINDTILDVTEIGTYVIKARYEGKNGYKPGEVSCELVVKKANLDIILIFEDWVYGDNPVYHIDGNDYHGEVIVKYYLDSEHSQLVTENNGVPTEAGKYYVVITIAETDFSNQKIVEHEVSIKTKEIVIIWDENNFVYNGEIQTIKAKFIGVKGEDIALNVQIDKEFKLAGTYTATASFAETQRSYVLPADTTKEFDMQKRAISIQIDDKSKYYLETTIPTLTAKVKDGTVVENEPLPYSLSCEVVADSAIGEYQITGTVTNENYVIDFFNGKFAVLNKVLGNYGGGSNIIAGWTYGQSPNTPSARAYYGTVQYKYISLDDYGNEEGWTTTVPSEPGLYCIRAEVVDVNYYNCAKMDYFFEISKIRIDDLLPDESEYIFDGNDKAYKLEENSTLYTISNRVYRNAGVYKIQVTLLDSVHYCWTSTNNSYLEYIFEIKKKLINKPLADSRVFKYTGKPISYNIAQSGDYNISNNNIQTEVGRYTITVTLKDATNTEWIDNSTSELNFDFVINQTRIDAPETKNVDGEVLNDSPVQIIETGINGLSPETKLNVLVIGLSNKQQIKQTKSYLKNTISNYDKIFGVFDVSLSENGLTVQPDGFITIKMQIPKELKNTNFRLYHIHETEDGKKIVSEIDYNRVEDSDFVTFRVENLSSFAFVYEQESLVGLIVTFSLILAILIALLVLQIIFMIKNKKKGSKQTKTVLASAVPVFFFASEVTASIVLGVLVAVFIALNITLFVISKKQKNKSKNPKEEIKDTQKIETKSKKNNKEKTPV